MLVVLVFSLDILWTKLALVISEDLDYGSCAVMDAPIIE